MNYYNEHDPKAAAWLRQLILDGLIPAGDVDERDIQKVQPHELTKYTQCHFFAGIGGWPLALQLAGYGSDVPVWTGSCPCQPFSAAGKGLGNADERHLWPVFFDLIKECRPELVFGEQVASAIGKGWLDGISADLETADYTCGATVLGAHSVGAPHIRQRLFWLAYAENPRCSRGVPTNEGCSQRQIQAGGAADRRNGSEQSFGGGNACRLADSQDHRYIAKDSLPQESGRGPTEPCDRSEVGGVADADEFSGIRVRGHALQPTKSPIACDSDSGLANANMPQRQRKRIPSRIQPTHYRIGDDNTSHGLGNTDSSGSQQGHATLTPGINHQAGAWPSFTTIPCGDNKARRIEPGLAPLVDGLPRGVVPSGDPRTQEYANETAEARVMRLKGYGNAIVPQVAAQFILATMEAINDL